MYYGKKKKVENRLEADKKRRVIVKQKCEEGEGISHVDLWLKEEPERGKSRAKTLS